MEKNMPSSAIVFHQLIWGGIAAQAQQDTLRPSSVGIYGNTTSLFQAPSPILNAFREKKFIYPFYQYADLSIVSPKYNFSSNSYLRYRKVFNGEQESLDVYNLYLDFSNKANTYEMRVGRQINTESVN